MKLEYLVVKATNSHQKMLFGAAMPCPGASMSQFLALSASGGTADSRGGGGAHRCSHSLPKEANLAVPPVPAVCRLHGCPCNQDRSDTKQGANQSSSVTSVIVCFPVPLPLFPKHEGMKRIQPEFIISVFRVEPRHHLLVWVPHSLQFSDFFLEFFSSIR